MHDWFLEGEVFDDESMLLVPHTDSLIGPLWSYFKKDLPSYFPHSDILIGPYGLTFKRIYPVIFPTLIA